MSDLLNKLGNKPSSVEGSGKASEPRQPTQNAASTEGFDRGDDLLAKAAGNKVDGTVNPTPTAPKTSSAESGQGPKSASSTEEPTGSQTNPTDWTADSALKEIRKLREENKAYRLKYAEQLEKVKQESDIRLEQKEQEMQSLMEAKRELDRVKADQEDKKRDLSEKVAHREARLAEMAAIMDAKEKEWKSRQSQYESKLADYEATRQAENQVYQSRLNEELAKVPEKFRDYANLIVKGAGDSREAIVALSEAKLRGMFEDRTVIVNHSVPGAHDGARASKERLEDAEKQRRQSMNSSQKIGEAIKSIKSGTPNPAFRQR